MLTLNDYEIGAIATRILNMPKYKDVQIPAETVRGLIENCLPISKNPADLTKRVREKLHNVVAPYLGDLDYRGASDEFSRIQDDPSAIREFALRALACHSSTKERGAELASLYRLLFEKTGTPTSIADLACGLHPLGLPFMDLPTDAAYYAYDLHKERADFLNAFITGLQYKGGCFHRDILVNPPDEKFDVAFFFKEAHRFEKREPGVLTRFVDSINADKIVVSLPARGFGSSSQIAPKYGMILSAHAQERGFMMDDMELGNEVFYIISRPKQSVILKERSD